MQKMFYPLDFFAAKDRLFWLILFFSHQRENSHWATRAAFELDRRGNQECAGLRQIFQVGQIFELIYASAQHQMMHGKIGGITGIDAQRVAAQSADFTRQESLRGFHRESWEMHFAVC